MDFEPITWEAVCQRCHKGERIRLVRNPWTIEFLLKHCYIPKRLIAPKPLSYILVKKAYKAAIYEFEVFDSCTLIFAQNQGYKVYKLDCYKNEAVQNGQQKIENSIYCSCDNPDMITNEANFKQFKYCRDCKKEVF